MKHIKALKVKHQNSNRVKNEEQENGDLLIKYLERSTIYNFTKLAAV